MKGPTNSTSINVDNVPTENSQAVITSGGVYTALGGKANTSQLTDGSVTKLGTASVGSDTKPIKLVNGVATVVTNDLAVDSSVVHIAGSTEYITGDKVFQGILQQRRATSSNIQLLNTSLRVDTATSGWTSTGSVRYRDQNGQDFAVIEGHQNGAMRGIYLNLNTSRTQGTDTWAGTAMGIFSNASGAYWCDHPRKGWKMIWEGQSTSGYIDTGFSFATNDWTWLVLRLGRNTTSEIWAYTYFLYPLNKWDGAFPMYCGAADGSNGIYMTITPYSNTRFDFTCNRSFLSGVYVI